MRPCHCATPTHRDYGGFVANPPTHGGNAALFSRRPQQQKTRRPWFAIKFPIEIEEIRRKIRELRTKPAFLRRLGPSVTKEELESVHQKTESLTRIFEEMSLSFFFFQKEETSRARPAPRPKLPQNGACKYTPPLPREPPHSPAPFCSPGSDSESESARASRVVVVHACTYVMLRKPMTPNASAKWRHQSRSASSRNYKSVGDEPPSPLQCAAARQPMMALLLGATEAP